MSSTEAMAPKAFGRLLATNNPPAAILWMLLCTEHLLNQLIEEKLPNGEAMVSDPRTYTFLIKLVAAQNKDLLPAELCENIKRLNDLRDQYARALDYQPSEEDLDFFEPGDIADAPLQRMVEGKLGILKRVWRGTVGRFGKSKTGMPGPGASDLRRIWALTYGWLSEYCKQECGVAEPAHTPQLPDSPMS
ncbi:MAG: hypothetical protein GXP25_14515 [Planctomycetes bacterium]|nr:hypothetical protein [Planctomycetota bacterium]